MSESGLPPWPTNAPRYGRVRLRPYETADVGLVQELAGDPYLPTVSTLPEHADPDQARGYIGRQLTRHRDGVGFPFVITLASTHRPVGTIGLWCEHLTEGRASAGYAVAPSARGHGYATDALLGLTDFAWSIGGLHTLELFIEPANAASCATATRAGFRADAGLVDHTVAGHRAPMLRYALLRP